jgi:hypothetical protein
LPRDFLKGRPRHANETLSGGRSQFAAFGWRGNVSLNEDIAVVRQNGRRTRTTPAQLGHYSVLTDDFCDFHAVCIVLIFLLVNQNCGFWFILGGGGV